jgi:hypothetical protein
MNSNPLDWPASYRQLLFILIATVGFTPSAYSYWKSEGEAAVFVLIIVSNFTLIVIVSVSVFWYDGSKAAS